MNFEHFFSHSVRMYRYLSKNRNWLAIWKQNTCMLIYTDDDVPSALLNKFENICSRVNATHICIVIVIHWKYVTVRDIHDKRNKRTFFHESTHLDSILLKNASYREWYCIPTPDFMVWILDCILHTNIQFALRMPEIFQKILIQVPSTIHPGQQNRMKQNNWKKKKRSRLKRIKFRLICWTSAYSFNMCTVQCIVYNIHWFVVFVALHALKTEHFLAINGMNAVGWNAVTIVAIDCDLLIVSDFLEQNHNQVNALR